MSIGGIDSKDNARDWPREAGMSSRNADARWSAQTPSKERARASSGEEYDASEASWYGSRGR